MQKIYLGVLAAFWSIYGLVNLIYPETLTFVAGLGQDNWSAAIEVRAMYGGLELAIGFLCILGLIERFNFLRAALVVNTALMLGLVAGRFVGLLIDGPDGLESMKVGFGLENITESYNAGALWFFELPSALIGIYLLGNRQEQRDS